MTAPTSPLTLPCGAVLPNRLMKSAMSEALGTPEGHADARLATLYRRWAEGGVGLSVTGNVMIDGRALGEPGNVILEDSAGEGAMRAWAEAGSAGGTAMWMQLNHPGKQAPKGLNRESVAPSAIPLHGDLKRYFGTPRALTEAEIEDIVERFGKSAALAKAAGFAGVQIHGAHGYLVSQFLSPQHNQREDGWGGSDAGRMRFALAVYGSIRKAVGPAFPVGIKLNSADFQRGGFTEAQSLDVVAALSEAGIDLIEVSGGTYETPVMASGETRKESTRSREAYFLEFAERARAVARAPLAVTGGFRTTAGIADALAGGALDMVGLGRSLALEPDFARRVLDGADATSLVEPIRTGIGMVDRTSMMDVAWYAKQIRRMAAGKEPSPGENKTLALPGILMAQAVGLLRARKPR